MSKREKYYLAGGIGFVVLFFVVQFVFFPLVEARENLARATRVHEKALADIMKLSAECKSLQTDTVSIDRAIAARPADFTLFSFLERQAGEAGLKGNIKYMKPSLSAEGTPYKESSVEMRLEDVTLEQLVEYLYLVESPAFLVHVKRISIKQGVGGSEYLTALIHLVTYQ